MTDLTKNNFKVIIRFSDNSFEEMQMIEKTKYYDNCNKKYNTTTLLENDNLKFVICKYDRSNSDVTCDGTARMIIDEDYNKSTIKVPLYLEYNDKKYLVNILEFKLINKEKEFTLISLHEKCHLINNKNYHIKTELLKLYGNNNHYDIIPFNILVLEGRNYEKFLFNYIISLIKSANELISEALYNYGFISLISSYYNTTITKVFMPDDKAIIIIADTKMKYDFKKYLKNNLPDINKMIYEEENIHTKFILEYLAPHYKNFIELL